MALDLSEKDLEDRNILGEKLITLAEIIVRKHFYASLSDKEDLVQVGVLKALIMIDSGTFSSSKGKFATFLYTGMRNEMHNYLYHLRKFNCVDIDSVIVSDDEREIEEVISDNFDVCIDFSLIHNVCKFFIPYYGEFIEAEVVKEISKIGYHVSGQPNEFKYTCYGDRLKNQYGRDVRDDIIGRLIGIILWNKHDLEMVR